MDKQIITKINKARFNVMTVSTVNFQLILNFNPLIEKFNLTGNYKLVHWQAKPKNSRRWGIYNSKDDSYQSLENFQLKGIIQSLQIPDKESISIPSAVLLLKE